MCLQEGVLKDDYEALRCFKRAAAEGHDCAQADFDRLKAQLAAARAR
jgi:hypothetical protein